MPSQQQTASDIAILVGRLQASINGLSTTIGNIFANDVDMKGNDLDNVGSITVDTVNYNSLNPPASGNRVANYSTFATVDAYANNPPVNLVDTPSSIGSLTFGSTLEPGSVIVINLVMTISCGGSEVVFAPVLTSGVDDLLAAPITIPAFQPVTPVTLKYTIAVRDETAIVSSITHNGSATAQSIADVAFDRGVEHTFAVMSEWTDSESGGHASVKSVTIETYFPRGA